MDAERWWPPFVEIVTVGWVLLFAVDVAVAFDLLVVSESVVSTVRGALQWLLVVFLLDLVLLYRWADDDLRGFVRSPQRLPDSRLVVAGDEHLNESHTPPSACGSFSSSRLLTRLAWRSVSAIARARQRRRLSGNRLVSYGGDAAH